MTVSLSSFSFYRSKEWDALRKRLMLERTDESGQLICARCGRPILRKYDCIAHHKIALTEENVNDATISLNPDNIELLHHRCHNMEHERFEGFRQRVVVVHGAPCSGKSSYVRENAGRQDLILDLDRIYEAIGTGGRHEKPKVIRPVAFAIRDTMMDQIRIRSGRWKTAWIITTKTGLELERDAERLKAELIHVDTDQQTCIENLKNDPDGRDVEEWKKIIADYFDRLQLQSR